MKIAFFIAAHKLERQFEWLFRALWNPHDIFLIHLNSACSEAYVSAIRRLTEGCPNVHFLPRMQITWGGWSLVEMHLEAIRFLCRRSDDWRYFVNLSGQDYPVRPLDEVRTFLERHDGTNFIEMKHIDTQPFHIRRRLHWYCIEHQGQLRRLPIPNLRAMLTAVKWYGGLWCNLSREFCNWLVVSELAKAYCRALRHTKCPDEFFFQNMIVQSPFACTLNRDPRRYLEFELRASGPKALTSKDLDRILGSSAFFARKFDENVDAEVLCQLASRISATIPKAA